MLLTWQVGLNASRYQRPRHLLRPRGKNIGNRVQEPAETNKKICFFIPVYTVLTTVAARGTNLSKLMVNTHFVRCAFVLCDPFGVLAALRGRQLSHSDLTIASAHGQGGVSTVRQELGLDVCNKRKKTQFYF